MHLTRKKDDKSRLEHGKTLLETLEQDRIIFQELVAYTDEKRFGELIDTFQRNFRIVYRYKDHKAQIRRSRDRAMTSLVLHVRHHLKNVLMKAERFGEDADYPVRHYDIPVGNDRPRSHNNGEWFIIAENTIRGDDLVRASEHEPVLEPTGDQIREKMAIAKEATRAFNQLEFERLMAHSELKRLRVILDRRFSLIRRIITDKLWERKCTDAEIRNHLRRFGYVFVGKDGKAVEEPETIDKVLEEQTELRQEERSNRRTRTRDPSRGSAT